MSRQDHWDTVYASKDPAAVSWYRPQLEQSLRWIDGCALDPSAHLVDIGGGASTLVDDLLQRGFERLAVLDLSARALERSQARLGARAEAVRWIVGDATARWFDDASVDLWHDRAVFHFLTAPEDRDAYLEQVRRVVRTGGYALLATFAPDGPERCSGLPVVRYAPDALAAALGAGFTLLDSAHEVHQTPWGSAQSFTYALCQRSSDSAAG